MSSLSAYDDVKAAIAAEGSDARVEVNQRALIDKILARYASAGAVYRELLQNSNDAEATTAEIIITTSAPAEKEEKKSKEAAVTQIIYRNNGHPFRPQDWARLRKIAEGNPDETKVGAFGVGAYTMFSICEEPLVVSGKRGEEEAMFFFWKGDGLWTKTGNAPEGIVNMSASLQKGEDNNNWTSFIMPSRDPYPLPDLVEFGQFLTASLTFTQCLANIKVYVDNTLQMDIRKTILESHTISTPKSSSWWKNDGAVTYSSSGMFALGKAEQLTQTSVLMNVSLRQSLDPNSEMETSKVRARYASAVVKTKIPQDIENRMIRVTKKKPPKELTVQIFLDAADSHEQEEEEASKSKKKKQSKAHQITDSFAPTSGSGKIFIGFRTSQTTGFGIHLAAPLMPTVEREAIDFVDPALRSFNSELLEISGILMRLALEHEMGRVGIMWDKGKEERELWKAKYEEQKKRKEAAKTSKEDEESLTDTKPSADSETTIQSSLFSFASYMARGVKNTVVEAIKAVPEILGEDDETTELLNPSDERPLSLEERDAIILMKAYCPRASTPDSLVGQCLARGFSRCLPNSSPPVLTQSGVVRGIDARLCFHGMEAFGVTNVVRRVMLENAREYHTVIATCPTLTMNDLIETMQSKTLTEDECVRLLKWWPKICKIDHSVGRYGVSLKESICFESKTASKKTDTDPKICSLDSILYYTPDKSISSLPLPDAAFAPELQKAVGLQALEDRSFSSWFSPLPFDIWAAFISSHEVLTQATFYDCKLRVQVLTALSKHFDSLGSAPARRSFINLLPTKTMYIPVETHDKNLTSQCRRPSEIYLSSSDLSAFEGLGKFDKVSSLLQKEGVSDQFLLSLGVRKTISMDFLFLHLDTLQWSSNPKSLINFLMTAELSQQDLVKLRSSKILPAKNDKKTLYSPRELYIPNEELRMFSFVRFLQWPGESMTTTERNFLTKKLGLAVDPPLSSVMAYLETESISESRDDASFLLALQYLTHKLGPNGVYERDFPTYRNVKFLPCLRQSFENQEIVKEIKSPAECFYNPSALVMGFSVLDPSLDTVAVATRTKTLKDPPPNLLIKRLSQYVAVSKKKLDNYSGTIDGKDAIITKILTLFEGIFLYLSSRTSDFDKGSVGTLNKMAFIPCKYRGQLVFYLPSQVFFKGDDRSDSWAESLFKEVEYNAFLSLAGVKAEPTLHELFDLMLKKPDEVLDSLGEAKYKTLLSRIAADPPFKKVTKEIQECAFLLGYLVMDEEITPDDKGDSNIQKARFVLARAEDIYIVDNSFLRRQFSMLICPHEQSLEEFYNKVGCRYVSQVVKKEYEVLGRNQRGTVLATEFANRISERRPLLLSPSVSSRPLVPDADKLLANLEIVEVDSINVRYTFSRSSTSIPTTSCAKSNSSKKSTKVLVFITHEFDWFDVGTAIGGLILERCQLEDAFFLSSIMEASLQTLRHRGFPVDRVLKPVAAPPSPEPVTDEPPVTNGTHANKVPTGEDDQMRPDNQPSTCNDGFDEILASMFPQCPLDVIHNMLGENPSKEKAREVANELSSMDFSLKHEDKTDHKTSSNNINTSSKKPQVEQHQGSDATSKKKSGGLMGRMMGGLRQSSVGGSKASSLGKRVVHQQAPEPNTTQSNPSLSSQNDAISQQSLEAMLQDSVQSTRSVQTAGVSAPETLLKTLPQGLECGSEGCEVIPQQNIIPFKTHHGTYAAKNDIRIFNSRNAPPSFLSQNFAHVERFAVVIQHLTAIYKVPLSSVAIFYDSSGSTIAFNSNKSLYFNIRFFVNLHCTRIDASCYSYWYTVMAHELAHNLVTAHNKEHGKFTESIIALYLPGFVNLLSRLAKPR